MRNQKGMTMFIAVVVMSILMLISLTVMNITIKSSLFANIGRESQFAFYAADAGLECALYWDSKFDPGKFNSVTSGSPINCGNASISNGSNISGTTTATTQIGASSFSVFGFNLNSTPYCVIVTVEKRLSDGKTYIKSRGYDVCDQNPRRVERGIEINY